MLVVDDHELIAAGLVCGLRQHGFDAHPVAVTDLGAVCRQAQSHQPGVVLLDLDLGLAADGRVLDGVELVTPLRVQGWTILIVTGTTELDRVAAAVTAGADGWIVKGAQLDELMQATVTLAEGRCLLGDPERRAMLERHRAAQRSAGQSAQRLAALTVKEREVLDRLTTGASATQIAEETYTSIRTVRAHIRNLLAKLEVNSQGAATAIAHRHRRPGSSIPAATWRQMRRADALRSDFNRPSAQP